MRERPQRRVNGPDCTAYVDAGAVGKARVQDADLRPQGGDAAFGFQRRPGLPHDLDVPGEFEQFTQATSDDLVIVEEENGDRHAT